MKDALSYTGQWWLPENPDDKVAGVLEYSQEDGIQLSLNGSFRDLDELITLKNHDKILGFTKDGKSITLVDCSDAGAGVHIPGYPVENYSPTIAYVGAHLDNLEETRFGKVSIQYEYLAEWAYTSGFRQSNTYTRDKRLEGWELTYHFPESVGVETSIGAVVFDYGFSAKGDPIRGYSAEQSTVMEINLSEPLGFEDLYHQVIYPLQDFLTFATGESNRVMDLRASTSDGSAEQEIQPQMIQILYRQVSKKGKREKRLDLDEMLFAMIQVPEVGLSQLLTRWLATHSEVKPALGAFFGNYYSPPVYIEDKFKNVVSALESYHRKNLRREVIPGAEYEQLVKSILENVPSDYKSFLAMKLKYANEQILADRIRSLMDIAAEGSLIISGNNDEFIKSVVQTRNYFTHYDETLREKALSGYELVIATRILSYVMQIVLLFEIGFTANECSSLLSKKSEFMRNLRLAREYFSSQSEVV